MKLCFHSHVFKILAIDGGGVRGVYPATLLGELSREHSIDFAHRFDLITGTSSGSIIAAALSLGIDIQKVEELFTEHSAEIFRKDAWAMEGVVKSKYRTATMKQFVVNLFSDLVLGDTKTRLAIPTSGLDNADSVIWRSYMQSHKHVEVKDIVLASTAAPSYFDPYPIGGKLYADGGMWANNPALLGVIEAVHMGIPLQDIIVLSIGTGKTKHLYDSKKTSKDWGIVSGWNGTKIVNMLIALQSSYSDMMLTEMMPKSHYIRVNFVTEKELPIDDVKLVHFLKEEAKKEYLTTKAALLSLIKKENKQTVLSSIRSFFGRYFSKSGG